MTALTTMLTGAFQTLPAYDIWTTRMMLAPRVPANDRLPDARTRREAGLGAAAAKFVVFAFIVVGSTLMGLYSFSLAPLAAQVFNVLARNIGAVSEPAPGM